MRGMTEGELCSSRPNLEASEAIEFCLSALYRDQTHLIEESINEYLTFEELIGALLLAKDSLNIIPSITLYDYK